MLARTHDLHAPPYKDSLLHPGPSLMVTTTSFVKESARLGETPGSHPPPLPDASFSYLKNILDPLGSEGHLGTGSVMVSNQWLWHFHGTWASQPGLTDGTRCRLDTSIPITNTHVKRVQSQHTLRPQNICTFGDFWNEFFFKSSNDGRGLTEILRKQVN